jgi:hypothetical protein
VGNARYVYDTQTDMDGFKDWVFNEVNESKNISRLLGFVPDTAAISSKLSQVKAVKGEYFKSLMSGALADGAMNAYAEFLEKLDKAGNRVIIEELQKQIDAFLASEK